MLSVRRQGLLLLLLQSPPVPAVRLPLLAATMVMCAGPATSGGSEAAAAAAATVVLMAQLTSGTPAAVVAVQLQCPAARRIKALHKEAQLLAAAPCLASNALCRGAQQYLNAQDETQRFSSDLTLHDVSGSSLAPAMFDRDKSLPVCCALCQSHWPSDNLLLVFAAPTCAAAGTQCTPAQNAVSCTQGTWRTYEHLLPLVGVLHRHAATADRACLAAWLDAALLNLQCKFRLVRVACAALNLTATWLLLACVYTNLKQLDVGPQQVNNAPAGEQ